MIKDNNEVIIVCSCCGHERIVKSDAYNCPECNEVAHVVKKYVRFGISGDCNGSIRPDGGTMGVWGNNVIRASHRFRKGK